MSSLREKLLRHKKPGGTGAASAEPEGAAAAAAVVSEAKPAADGSEWAEIGAHLEHNERGSFVLRRVAYEGSYSHGRYRLNELQGQSDYLMSILLPGDVEAVQSGLSYEQLLYLDTETTGLGIGAGNVPFMIGIGFYEGQRLVVEQMFIRNPGEELAMLHHLEGRLKRHPYLVSYNGKTFDWPLIKNRYILNRMPSEPDIAGHLDFLYPSRSLWRHTLPSCRLGKVEEERLHVTREEDVPGSLAPTLYFQYLAEKDVSVVKGIFVHNELDLLSLAGLSIHFSRVLQGKYALAEMELEEQYRLGLWFDKLGLETDAEPIFERLRTLLLQPEPDEETAEYLLPLAQVYKQRHRYEEAVRLWSAYVERKGQRGTASTEPYIELSMHYEHREKRLALALEFAEQALGKTRLRQSLLRPRGQEAAASRGKKALTDEQRKQQAVLAGMEKRIERLRRKLEREEQAGRSKRSVPGASAGRKRAAREESGYWMDSLI
ncbi:hypothetical protein SK3146_00796 [Paenibacillus konkukensis]|uniref:YprB ribonuclease H-like domain-containing protein n=1 Tax=Paenibacillus konkukensis TaxID=2020716 RepID=A0ABY4RIK6_9BACL|nr:ribonuclease H-like domain-containing protein [Paenibacillus konkukensis]UQZ81640.1 hypothetical protein SK3146_00796 [Paenibacillus konkukensis]